MTTQFTIVCGLDTNGHRVDARALILDLAVKAFPHGHTIRESVGRWMTDQPRLSPGSNVYRKIVTEPTIEVVWLADDSITPEEAWKRVSDLAAAYKAGAFQEAVMITRQEVDACFI